MKVVFQYQGLITDGYKSFFNKNVPEGVELVYMEERDKEPLLKIAPEIDVFVGYSITEEFIKKSIKLRHIQIPWTGFNNFGGEHVKDKEHITVSNSHSNSLAIAEHAVALLLAASKLLSYRDLEMRKGNWATRYNETNSFWLSGKKLGIIGYGAIGKKVTAMLKIGFNMDVLAIKRHPGVKDEMCDFLGGMDDLDHLLKESDYVVICLPMTEETKGLIAKEHFELMKSTAVLVNIARGPIIDEEALYVALKQNQIGAAGIDVWYNYPKFLDRSEDDEGWKADQNFPYHDLPNIVMTPHSAFKIRDREEIFAQDILTNIIRVYENREPINLVNLELGY